MLVHSFTSWLAFASVALALPQAARPTAELVERQDGACTNTPQTRQCWTNGYSISTDFDAKSPPDGTTVTYYLEIATKTIPNPDGSGGTRDVQLVNGTYPGPLIRAKWGDTVIVNVKNNLEFNGTGIHWHGVRQLNSCQSDGVPGVTECPIAPGKIRQYKFRATQFGTSWYHSHWSSQYADGVLGPLIIDGPATSNYDVDLGALPLNDWYYTSAYTLAETAQHGAGSPQVQNILVNGTHVSGPGKGNYARIKVAKGKKYRLRLINMSVDSYMSVSMDGHPFTVITSDFVPTKKWTATQLSLAVGQRYDVIIEANQTVGNYWFRVQPATGCSKPNAILSKGVQIGAILQYDGANDDLPTTSTNETMRTACADEPTSNIVPFVPNQVPQDILGSAGHINMSYTQNTETRLVRWLLDGSPQIVNWNLPSLEGVSNGTTSFGANSNVYPMPNKNAWYLWWIQSTASLQLPHPIHLHGHDYYILGSGQGVWDGTSKGLNFNNPTRRDTATLPPNGYLLMAFPADNPGMWVAHCHIAWHASQGLSMQFGERYSDIKGGALGDLNIRPGCAEWAEYESKPHPWDQTDSGI